MNDFKTKRIKTKQINIYLKDILHFPEPWHIHFSHYNFTEWIGKSGMFNY